MLQLPRKAGEPRRCVYGRTVAEVEAKYQAALGMGAVKVRPGSISEFAALHWFDWKRARVQPSSYLRYAQHWEIQIGPTIGHYQFGELTEMILQECVNKGASASARQNIKHLLTCITRRAIAHEWPGASPTILARIQAAQTGHRPIKELFDPFERAKIILKRADGTWMEGPIYAAMTLGLRAGEVRGLRLCDIDTQAGTLTIQRQHTQHGLKDRLKSKKEGERFTIGVPPEILTRLASYQRPNAIALFSTEDGKPLGFHLEREMARLQEGLENPIRFHDLRKAAVTQLIARGVADHIIMDICRWATPAMIRTYRASSQAATREALKTVTDV